MKPLVLLDFEFDLLTDVLKEGVSQLENELLKYPASNPTGSIMRKGIFKDLEKMNGVLDKLSTRGQEVTFGWSKVNWMIVLLRRRWNELAEPLNLRVGDLWFWISLTKKDCELILELDGISQLMKKLKPKSNQTPRQLGKYIDLIDNMRACQEFILFTTNHFVPYKIRFLNSKRQSVSLELNSPLPSAFELTPHGYTKKWKDSEIRSGGGLLVRDLVLAKFAKYGAMENSTLSDASKFTATLLNGKI